MSSSVKKAFTIIRYIADHQGELTLSELGRRLKTNKTTMFRYLETLETLHILEKRKGTYSLGMELFFLGHQVDIRKRIVERVHSIISSCSRRVNETLSFAGYINGAAVYLDKVESSRGLQMRARLGDELPFHCTALGKSILSIIPSRQLEETIQSIKMIPYTHNTLTDKKMFNAQLDKVKQDGYSLEKEELETGLSCISVPLRSKRMNFYGAVSFSGSSSHLTEERMMSYVTDLLDAAAEITAVLDSKENESN